MDADVASMLPSRRGKRLRKNRVEIKESTLISSILPISDGRELGLESLRLADMLFYIENESLETLEELIRKERRR